MKKQNKVNKKHYNIRDRVSIIRHRHGWSDGAIKGVITSLSFRIGGAAFYTVTDDSGMEYDVRATKDLLPC